MGDGWKDARRNAAHNYVPVERARQALGDLTGQGWTCKRVAEVTGLSPTTLTKIVNRRVATVAESTYEAILSLIEPPGERLPLRQRFDAEPLICAIAVLGIGAANADKAADGSHWSLDDWLRTSVKRWRAEGLSWQQADLWANRLGLHPADQLLWGDDWWAAQAAGEGALEAV